MDGCIPKWDWVYGELSIMYGVSCPNNSSRHVRGPVIQDLKVPQRLTMWEIMFAIRF